MAGLRLQATLPVVAFLVGFGCLGAAPPAVPREQSAQSAQPSASPSLASSTDGAGSDGCAATLPLPPAEVPEAALLPIVNGSNNPEIVRARPSMYGSGDLWIVIPRDGVTKRDLKMPAVRLVPGVITATARRLGGTASPADFAIPDGYGPVGFQAMSVRFPAAGCWEITARLAGSAVRLTLLVEE